MNISERPRMVFEADWGSLHTVFAGEDSIWEICCTCQLEGSGGT